VVCVCTYSAAVLVLRSRSVGGVGMGFTSRKLGGRGGRAAFWRAVRGRSFEVDVDAQGLQAAGVLVPFPGDAGEFVLEFDDPPDGGKGHSLVHHSDDLLDQGDLVPAVA